MPVFQPNGLYFIRYVPYLFLNLYPDETQTTSTHRINLTLHFIVVNIFWIIALAEIATRRYIMLGVIYIITLLYWFILLDVWVLNTLEWTLNLMNFSNILCPKFDTKNIFYDLQVQCILCTMCNHNAEYWRYTIYHLPI